MIVAGRRCPLDGRRVREARASARLGEAVC
jgi:hypothetical protein